MDENYKNKDPTNILQKQQLFLSKNPVSPTKCIFKSNIHRKFGSKLPDAVLFCNIMFMLKQQEGHDGC